MEAKFRNVKEKTTYKTFYHIVRQRTTIRPKDILLLYNLLAALLKKKLFEDKEVRITGLGRFYLYDCKNGQIIRFKMFKKLKRILHNLKEQNSNKFYVSYKTLNDIFLNCARCTGLKVKQTAFLFYIWVHAIIQTLISEKGCKVKGLGFLYINKLNYEKKRGINKNVKFFYRVSFKSYRQTLCEVKKQQEIFFNKRIKSLLKLNSI